MQGGGSEEKVMVCPVIMHLCQPWLYGSVRSNERGSTALVLVEECLRARGTILRLENLMASESEQRPHGVDGSRGTPCTSEGTAVRHVTLIPGEGAGAEVMSSVRRVLHAAGAEVEWEVAEAGEQVRAKGIASGLPWETIDSLQRTGLVIRGSLALPGAGLGPTERVLHQGFDIASQAFRIRSLPGLPSGLGERDLDLWLVRNSLREMEQELELDLPCDPQPTDVPAGPVDERVFRRAFELARREGFTRVHCATRSGRHGLLRVQRTFFSVAADYPQILAESPIDTCLRRI